MSLVNFLSLSRQCQSILKYRPSILKNRPSIVALAVKGCIATKRQRQTRNELLEQRLDVFYNACKAKKLKTITYDMMIMKGKDIADGLISASLVNTSDLPATDFVWKSHIQRFLKKRETYSESGDANCTGAQHFLESVWPDCVLTMTPAECTTWTKLGSFGERWSTSACKVSKPRKTT